jgi:hypothetical protein
VKILHILNDGPSQLSSDIISVQAKDHELKIIDLSKRDVSYETVVNDIFASDKVVSW